MPTPEPKKHIYSVSELTLLIKEMLEGKFPLILVEGEISGYKISPSGHAYFRLKDETSIIDAVLWRHQRLKNSFPIEDGMKVIIQGGLSVYPPQGRYQIVVEKIEPAGLGELQRRFDLLKTKLAAEGLFDSSRKIPIPLLPERIGLITSFTGAAIQDFLKIIHSRFPGGHFLIYGTRVQGKEAPPEIVRALQYFDKTKYVDVVILTRGGGSLEDLWAFNEEIVARAIAACETPVISAVGHEIDFTISDFVADLRLPTPTAAAAFIVRNRETAWNKTVELRKRLLKSLVTTLKSNRQNINSLVTQFRRLSPLTLIARYRQTLDEKLFRIVTHMRTVLRTHKSSLKSCQMSLPKSLSALLGQKNQSLIQEKHRLALSVRNIKNLGINRVEHFKTRLPIGLVQNLQRYKSRLVYSVEKLKVLDPERTLARGYAICRESETGKIITQPAEVDIGDQLDVKVRGGHIPVKVTSPDGTFQKQLWRD